jgi:hypothetical protein
VAYFRVKVPEMETLPDVIGSVACGAERISPWKIMAIWRPGDAVRDSKT